MKTNIRLLLRCLTLILCVNLFFSQSISFAVEEKNINVAFIGNTELLNPQKTEYPKYVAAYLEERLNQRVNLICTAPVDFDSETFMNTLKPVQKHRPEMVFIELNISRRYKSNDAEISAKLEAIVRSFLDGDKVPAIYFLYMPEDTLKDYRAPFDAVAKYYGATVIDLFKPVKNDYLHNEQFRFSDYLTAGVIPSEEGHCRFAELIKSGLRGMDNLFKSVYTDKPAMAKSDVYKLTEDQQAENEKVQAGKDEGMVIYVAKNGSSNNPGTIESPLSSLDSAQKLIRHEKQKLGDDFKGATVYIREGLYQLKEGFTLTASDSGTESAPITYCAYENEAVRVTNAEILEPKHFKPVTDETVLKRIPSEAWGNVLEYDLGTHGINPGTYLIGSNGRADSYYTTSRSYSWGNILVVNGKNEQRARYPNGGNAYVAAHQTTSRTQIAYSTVRGENWVTAENAWVTGVLGQGYFTEHMKVKDIDTENGLINVNGQAPYGVKVGWLWNICNLLEELDTKGEWYADENTKKLYYYPRDDITNDEILFSSNTSPIITVNGASHISFQGITVEGGCGSGIKIINGRNNTVVNCTLRNLGFCGVHINNSIGKGPGHNGVIGCHVHTTAMVGVYIDGGDRCELTDQGDYVEECHIENYAIEMHSETGGVATDGTVGVRISKNNIHNDDSAAVFMGGNDDLIEYNEIYNVCKNTDDYGAIYGDSRGAMRQGVYYHHNYMHDVIANLEVGVYHWIAGFYADAQRNNGARVTHNVFEKVTTPIFFSNNHNMLAQENLILEPYSRSIDVRHMHYDEVTMNQKKERLKELLDTGTIESYRGKGEGKFFDNLLYRGYFSAKEFNEETKDAYFLKYPWLETYLYDDPMEAKNIVVKNNAVFAADPNATTINAPEIMGPWIDTVNNYIIEDAIVVENSKSEYDRIGKAMEIAKEKVGEFEIWDVKESGISGDARAISDFDIVSPANGAKEVDVTELVLTWDYASGADEYYVKIASDAEMKNVLFEGASRDNYIKVPTLELGGKKYYWQVTAKSFSEKFTGEPKNANGIHSFTSMRTKKTETKELLKALATAERIYDGMKEGEKPGEYKPGAKAELYEAYNEANEFYQKYKDSSVNFTEQAEKLNSVITKTLAKINLEETDGLMLLKTLSDVTYNPISGSTVRGDETPVLNFSGDELSFNGSGSIYTKERLDAHKIIRCKAKFNFGAGRASDYSMFALRAQQQSGYMYNTTCYVFLVTKDNIELQGFKTMNGGKGKFYLTVPNTFIEEGKYYDIEFATVPANEGDAVRIILMIDGEIVYDYLDETNIIDEGGYFGVHSRFDTTGVCLMAPESHPPYQTILQQLADPNSALNKKTDQTQEK